MAIDWPELEQEAIRVFRAVAPCLGQVEYRIIDQALVPAIADSCCGAFVHPTLDCVVKKLLPAADLPDGRFLAIVWNRRNFEACKYTGEDVSYKFLSLMLHELAHSWDYPAWWDLPVKNPERDVARLVTLHDRSRPLADLRPADRLAEERHLFNTHKADFVKICLHFCHRTRVRTKWRAMGPADIIRCRAWQSLPGYYHQAIGTDPALMIDYPLKDILAAPPPAAFLALAQRDELAMLKGTEP